MNILTNAIINQENIKKIDSLISDDNINLQDSDGMTPLHCLINICYINKIDEFNFNKEFELNGQNDEIIELLLIRGANPNIPDKNGNTILHTIFKAIPYTHEMNIQNEHIIDLLIKHGANINLQNNSGNYKKVFFVSRKINFFVNL